MQNLDQAKKKINFMYCLLITWIHHVNSIIHSQPSFIALWKKLISVEIALLRYSLCRIQCFWNVDHTWFSTEIQTSLPILLVLASLLQATGFCHFSTVCLFSSGNLIEASLTPFVTHSFYMLGKSNYMDNGWSSSSSKYSYILQNMAKVIKYTGI